MGRCTDWEGRDRYHIFSSVAVDVAVDESNISSVDQDSSTLRTQEMHPELAFRELLPFWGDGMWAGHNGLQAGLTFCAQRTRKRAVHVTVPGYAHGYMYYGHEDGVGWGIGSVDLTHRGLHMRRSFNRGVSMGGAMGIGPGAAGCNAPDSQAAQNITKRITRRTTYLHTGGETCRKMS